MTREEASKVIKDGLEDMSLDFADEEQYEALTMAIKALEQEPSGDLISRQTVQDYIAKYLSQYLYDDVREAVEVIDEYIGELPPVKQEPKTRHWIEKDGFDGDVYYDCSECGESFCLIDGTPTDNLFDYCPNCGCRMVQERSDKE